MELLSGDYCLKIAEVMRIHLVKVNVEVVNMEKKEINGIKTEDNVQKKFHFRKKNNVFHFSHVFFCLHSFLRVQRIQSGSCACVLCVLFFLFISNGLLPYRHYFGYISFYVRLSISVRAISITFYVQQRGFSFNIPTPNDHHVSPKILFVVCTFATFLLCAVRTTGWNPSKTQ